MSFKIPVDSFSTNPLRVIFGAETRREVGGLSIMDLVLGALALVAAYAIVAGSIGRTARVLCLGGQVWFGWIVASALYGVGLVIGVGIILPAVLGAIGMESTDEETAGTSRNQTRCVIADVRSVCSLPTAGSVIA